MKQILVILLMGALSSFALAHEGHDHGKAAQPDATAKAFGGKMAAADVLTLSEVTTNFDKYDGKTVTFTGTAKKVCQKKGCWMVVSDGSKEVRTLFKDYGFFVPASILGKKVKVQGTMEKKRVSAATLRHYAKDAGKKRSEVQKIKKPETQFQFTADAVEII